MTREAKTRRLRRRRVSPMGDVRRGAGGVVEMIEFTEYRPNPFAHEVLVNRLCGIYRASGLIKCVFGFACEGPANIVECVERVRLIWTPPDVIKINEQFDWAFKEMLAGNFLPDDGGGRRPRTQ